MQYAKSFVALESDPDIFTDLMHALGVSKDVSIIDVWSLDQSALEFVPRPVLALILILPPGPAFDRLAFEQPQDAKVAPEKIVWLKQTINNACGLYALLHAVCNRPEIIVPGTALDSLMKVNPVDRVKHLETSTRFETIYSEAAKLGNTEVPLADDIIEHHYICLVESDGELYELDGDMEGPTHRGHIKGTEDVLGETGLSVLRRYIDSQADGTFSLMAMIKT